MDPEIGAIRREEYDRLYEIVGEQIGDEDVEDVRVSLEGPHARPGDWVVARVDGHLAACAVVVPMAARIGSVALPALQAEVVATDPSHTGKGLQRAIFAEIHARHPDRVFHVIEGIPFFYRRLGYEYAIPQPSQQVVDGLVLPDGWEVQDATHADVPLLMEMQEEVQGAAGVAVAHPAHLWHWVIDSSLYRVVIASNGVERAVARGYGSGSERFVMETAATSIDGVRAVAAALADGVTARIYHRPGLRDLAGVGGRTEPSGYAYYARLTDPAGVLDRLRPEFDARLATSDLAGWSGRFLLSQYDRSFVLEVVDGVCGPVQTEGPVHAPVAAGGSGVPPDLFAHLVLGSLGAVGLAERHADVLLGAQADLMAVLFPAQTADVHTWVAP